MKKLFSLIKATMSTDMNIFKISQKKSSKKKNNILVFLITIFFMFTIWSNANIILEKLTPLGIQDLILPLFVIATAFITIIEGVYKAGPLMFNCRDDQLLLSLPIKRSTVLFIRIFKFYLFELIFHSLFFIPLIIAYLRWTTHLNLSFFITSIIMLLFLPIIPIVISCLIGSIITTITSHLRFKNLAQILITTLFLLLVFYLSYNLDSFYNYLSAHITTVNDFIMKIYYPAGVYLNLVTNFNILELLLFIIINILIILISIFILSKYYFQINSRLKNVITTPKNNNKNLIIKKKTIYQALINKELNTFFKTPVFIINAGFGLVLFLVLSISLSYKFDSIINLIINSGISPLNKQDLLDNLSILILFLIIITSFMTSITNSVISLEGRNINILKSLPLSSKTILMSKIYSSLLLTTPILLVGDIILFISFKINLIECLLLIVLSILMPLVSHFLGIIINLKYPKLDAENSSEVVKQSTSSFLAVMIGMLLLIINIAIISSIVGKISSLIILIVLTFIYLIIDIILYLVLIKKGVKDFDNLSI